MERDNSLEDSASLSPSSSYHSQSSSPQQTAFFCGEDSAVSSPAHKQPTFLLPSPGTKVKASTFPRNVHPNFDEMESPTSLLGLLPRSTGSSPYAGSKVAHLDDKLVGRGPLLRYYMEMHQRSRADVVKPALVRHKSCDPNPSKSDDDLLRSECPAVKLTVPHKSKPKRKLSDGPFNYLPAYEQETHFAFQYVSEMRRQREASCGSPVDMQQTLQVPRGEEKGAGAREVRAGSAEPLSHRRTRPRPRSVVERSNTWNCHSTRKATPLEWLTDKGQSIMGLFNRTPTKDGTSAAEKVKLRMRRRQLSGGGEGKSSLTKKVKQRSISAEQPSVLKTKKQKEQKRQEQQDRLMVRSTDSSDVIAQWGHLLYEDDDDDDDVDV